MRKRSNPVRVMRNRPSSVSEKDEIRPDFTIDEPHSNEARATFLANHAPEAREILAKELKRREKKAAKADDEDGPLFDQNSDQASDDPESADD